ncbi:hypothetical protein DM01DRAFT_253489 [Hesseltinella vesiculosa]|uniref:Uncharacterized protein n=1 Tax=Hesseltinella vesiculosa TaxID=101127 RepID=A0A1X2G829_9FUNG|nr:hypothetical protein DM01DRAFT_253489 [Hesseltinella vesiculosa]
MSHYVDQQEPADLDVYLPSTEESLQQWLSRNVPSELPQEACPCCSHSQCPNYAPFYDSMHKLEDNTRLAAEIGQDLLLKHEALIRDSNKSKAIIEHQIQDFKIRVSTLEQFLEESLQETAMELERVNERCIELGNELKHQAKQVERFRIFKVMAREADAREDGLRLQLDDTTQELALARKNALLLECKYKKLKTNYGKLKLDLSLFNVS